jgi:hypothetical protein
MKYVATNFTLLYCSLTAIVLLMHKVQEQRSTKRRHTVPMELMVKSVKVLPKFN